MTRLISLIALGAVCLLSSCGPAAKTEKEKPAPPAKVQNGGVKEVDLATITLTPQAEQRLGIQTAVVEYKRAHRFQTLAGEVTIPPGQALAVSAPVAGTVQAAQAALTAGAAVRQGQPLLGLLPLLPLPRDLRVTAQTEVAAARARLDNARAKAERADQLLKERVGSVRAQEDARQELQVAEAAFQAAREKLEQINRAPLDADVSVTVRAPRTGILRQVHAAPGQQVSAGAPLFEVASLDPLWVRVPVYIGDLASFVPGAGARVRAINEREDAPGRLAPPVAAPPSADPLAATGDLYFELANATLALRPGQKVSVTLPLRTQQSGLHAPRSAVLYDMHGGTWVYENTAPQTFVRRRVEVSHFQGPTAVLARGVAPGTRVVKAGAAELFGTEFGAGK